jgi:hypothetical protein
MKSCWAIVAAASLLATACGHTDTTSVLLRPAADARRSSVELYFASQTVPHEYYEVALLQSVGYGSDANFEDVTDALRRRAASLGCDALVRVTVDQGFSVVHGYGICAHYIGPVSAPAGKTDLPVMERPPATGPSPMPTVIVPAAGPPGGRPL